MTSPSAATRRRAAGAVAGSSADVVQAERLREVRALAGFTRLDAPDPEDPDLVTRAPLARDRPTWVPASEVRGEGIFLRIERASCMTAWEDARPRLMTWSASTGTRSAGSAPTATPTGCRATSTRCAAGPSPATSPCTPCRTC